MNTQTDRIATDRTAPSGREQPWSDDEPEHGQIVVVTDNPIGRSLVGIASIVGRRAVLLADENVEQMPIDWLADHPLGHRDAFVMCDHDTPGMPGLLGAALDGDAGYVAMMGSRRRAEMVFAELEQTRPPETLARLHVPAGLNTGGKSPGEIALSVMAEIVAFSYGRDGGAMTSR